MATYLDHIGRTNPAVNAIISLRPRDELLAEAREADDAVARGKVLGPNLPSGCPIRTAP